MDTLSSLMETIGFFSYPKFPVGEFDPGIPLHLEPYKKVDKITLGS
jgi:hypothetical protein